jgi:hypothetical protein
MFAIKGGVYLSRALFLALFFWSNKYETRLKVFNVGKRTNLLHHIGLYNSKIFIEVAWQVILAAQQSGNNCEVSWVNFWKFRKFSEPMISFLMEDNPSKNEEPNHWTWESNKNKSAASFCFQHRFLQGILTKGKDQYNWSPFTN